MLEVAGRGAETDLFEMEEKYITRAKSNSAVIIRNIVANLEKKDVLEAQIIAIPQMRSE